MSDELTAEFEAGVDAYWSGVEPEGWRDSGAVASTPYLAGWYMASMWETSPGWIKDRDGDPLQEGICGDCGEEEDYCVCIEDDE